jgi:hypothetical protein
MPGLLARWGRSRRSTTRTQKSSKARKTVLHVEAVEPRLMLSGTPTPVHSAPTVAHALTASNNGIVTGTIATLSVLGSDAAGESTLTYNWSVTSAPAGGSARFSVTGSNAAKNDTVTFNEAGTYGLAVKIVDRLGLSVTATTTVKVTPTLASISVSPGTSLTVSGKSQVLTAQGLDQFGHTLTTQPTFQWSATTVPAGAAAPTFATSAASTTVTFAAAGSYNLKVVAGGSLSVSAAVSATVKQTATSISVTPGSVTVAAGAKQQFSAKMLDQFQNVLATQPAVTWAASGGSITTSGLLTSPTAAGSYTITAKSGSLTGTATAIVQANSGGLQNAFLANLVTTLDAAGSINRNDMIQIFNAVAAKGTVTASEFSDLKTILSEASSLNMPGYVQVLAGDVINGNAANATYQGQKLGNLAAGSSATQLNDLVGKWFLGTDEPIPDSSSYVYKTVSGSLFSGNPSHLNEQQGMLGDCYFISTLGTIADSNPAAIQNMFINNGDGTYTVRFYTGSYGTSYNPSNGSWSDGFTNNQGTADYVTVDSKLPTTSSGMLVYSDYGNSASSSSNVLWIALAEKAYAEWNQTGKEGRDGTNNYASIAGGWMATVDAQVLGHNATDYSVTNADEKYAINALAAHQAVTTGTFAANYGLVADHAYAIIGYTASTGTFTLYNPWGFDQPGQLTWSQLEATCDGFVVANPSGSTPISGPATKSGVGGAAVSDGSGGAAVQANAVTVTLAGGGSIAPPAAPSGDIVSLPAIDAVFASDVSSWTDAVNDAA